MGRERTDKGKGKVVEKAKRTPTEKEWERANAAVDAYNRQQQGQGFEIRDTTTHKLKVSLSVHKTLNWRYMGIAAGGADVRCHFDSIPGLTDLLTDVDHYVEDWWFDIVDFILCEIEDVITDGMTMEFLPPLPHRHDQEAGKSTQGAQPSVSLPSAPETTPPVPPPAAQSSEFSQFLQQMMVQQQQMILQQQAAQEEKQLKYQADFVHQQEQQALIIQSVQQQQQQLGQQLPALAPAPAPVPSPLPGGSTSLLSTLESSFPLSALLATRVLSEPVGTSQRPVLPSLTSPLPTGPLRFEDTPQLTITEQQQPVVPPPVAEPALDEPDATL
ncbi:uncharacterized protein LOC133928068 [Phragmites australis]|uniref:uncharacterized protein LOC133928068 n=1 Tax=Phragmites australis TaxID=29695 RepID=UPI002D785C15|nr:uncharacterized protein LOC133928068 [Phragmites australis]